jgi:hypothetical protein
MRKLTKHQIERALILKAARTAIRLKHAMMCDRELCERVPEIAKQIEDAFLQGKKFRFSLDDATK